jgi:hypothetical protein
MASLRTVPMRCRAAVLNRPTWPMSSWRRLTPALCWIWRPLNGVVQPCVNVPPATLRLSTCSNWSPFTGSARKKVKLEKRFSRERTT